MLNERRLIAVALVVIAAALVAIVVGQVERTAEAEPKPGATILEVQTHRLFISETKPSPSIFRLFRVWSDGTIEAKVLQFETGLRFAQINSDQTPEWCDIDDVPALLPCVPEPQENTP